MEHPTSNLTRALDVPVEYRDDSADTVTIAFARYNEWTEINSAFEGNFLERVAPGAFDESFGDRAPRVLYEHGRDPSIGNKPLGTPSNFRSKGGDALVDVELFDADYVHSLRPAMKARQLGASFRFSVVADTWSNPSRATQHNPGRLPERTLDKVRVFEFGPVTFPAYAGAGMRSTTDEWLDALVHDPRFVARLTETYGEKIVARMIPPSAADGSDGQPALSEPTDGGTHPSILRARLRALSLRS